MDNLVTIITATFALTSSALLFDNKEEVRYLDFGKQIDMHVGYQKPKPRYNQKIFSIDPQSNQYNFSNKNNLQNKTFNVNQQVNGRKEKNKIGTTSKPKRTMLDRHPPKLRKERVGYPIGYVHRR